MRHADAGGVVDRVPDRGQRRHDRHLADAAHAVGVPGVRDLFGPELPDRTTAPLRLWTYPLQPQHGAITDQITKPSG